MDRTGRTQKTPGRHGIRKRLTGLFLLIGVPLTAMSVYLLIALHSYAGAYDEIVSNLTVAGSYNLDFRNELDESIYKLVVRGLPMEEALEDDSTMADPYAQIDELRHDFKRLEGITTDSQSRQWLGSLLRNINTLKERLDDIKDSLAKGGSYQENLDMLDNNIYILTELIQDDIQYYIYYQTRSIEGLKEGLNVAVRNMMVFSGILLAALILAVLAWGTHIVRSITRPLEELVQVTSRIAKGDFEARAADKGGKDEIAALSDSVNDMARHLDIMVRQIKEDERRLRWQELRLLQEQINPHFLYNTLDTIVWLIEGGKYDDAEDMIMSLSAFFKLVLSRGREIITVREEEQHILSYLQIQRYRYSDLLSYEIVIDPALYPYGIPKMTLQPLVENALYHGIKHRRSLGRLIITGEMEDGNQMCFKVKDDGVGMSGEELRKLQEEVQKPSSQTESGYGMANVSERIRMNYGKPYGLSIDSVQGKGTVVTVRLPALEAGKPGEEALS